MWDLLFPQNCVGCNQKGSYICQECLAKANKAAPSCPVCGRFNFKGKTHPSCASKNDLNGLISLWKYEGVVKEAIHIMKYKYVGLVATQFIKHSPALDLYAEEIKESFLVPIPIHISRERNRGFNQTELLARAIAHEYPTRGGLEALVQKEPKASQVGSAKKDRLRNISGKYAVNSASLIDPDAHYLIVDDVWTTGATMREAAKVLKKAGARTVWGIVIAKG